MPFDVDLALHFLTERARALTDQGPPRLGPLPPRELGRSPAAAQVTAHAARSGLFLYHFEHRSLLSLPEDWLPIGRPDLGAPPVWEDGVLPEPKYQSFRHDLPLGSFHPGHRAKWSTHELCHGLVGFAWHPAHTRLMWMDAARLAELLPVTLYYFLDEVLLTRCPAHAGQGALFRTFCPDCEAAAAPARVDAVARERLEGAKRFLDGELAAVARTRRTGIPQHHRWTSIDLCSDALAYVAAHGERMASDAFARFVAEFTVADGGRFDTLDALEARVLDTTRALVSDAPLAPLAPSPAHGRWRWVAQDLGWRLLQVQHQTEGELHAELDALLEPLVQLVAASTRADSDIGGLADAALAQLAQGWQALAEEYVFPDADELFAVGYPLPHVGGQAVGQLLDGLTSGLPRTTTLLGEGLAPRAARFFAADPWERRPLGQRFADWLAGEQVGPLAELCRYEATITHLPARDAAELALGAWGTGWRLSRAWTLLDTHLDVVQLHEDVGFGDVELHWEGDEPRLLDVDGASPVARACHWALGRGPDGAPAVLELTPEQAEALGTGAIDPDAAWVDNLAQLGILVPENWAF